MSDLGRSVSGRDLAVLAAILVLAAVLRIIGLNAPLWFDEIATVTTHVSHPWGDMLTDYSMNHHYFFSIKAKLATMIFGEEPWVYRLAPAVFGVATVAVIWWLAHMAAGPGVAHVSALLVALSYHQVWFSQNARGYTELAFWCTLGLVPFLKGVKTPGLGVWLGFGASAAAAAFTHLTGVFFFIALGLVWLAWLAVMAARGRIGRAQVFYPLVGTAFAAVVTILVYLPVLPGIFETVGSLSEDVDVDPVVEYRSPVWSLMEGLRTATGGMGPLTLAAGLGTLAAFLLGGLAARRAEPLLFWSVVVHVGVTIAILSAVDMRIWPRFFFVDIGLVLVLAVIGVAFAAERVSTMLNRPGWDSGLFALAVAAMIGLSLVLLPRNYAAPKQDMRAAFELVEAERRPLDRVLGVGPGVEVFRDYFGADWQAVFTPADYDAALADAGPAILVVAFPNRMFETIPRLRQDSASDLTLLRELPGTLGDGYILVYRRP
jgi:hypothetical protein